MTYDEIRPIREREYNKIQTLFKQDKDVQKTKKKRVADETLLQESFKKLRAAKVSGSESTQEIPTDDPKEITKEDVQNMLDIVPVLEFRVEALQVKYPIIDWEIHTEEKDYPLSNAVKILMLSEKLQVEEDNEMAKDLVMKIFMEANRPRNIYESVGSRAPRVILFGAILAISPVILKVPIVLIDHLVAPEVGTVSVVSPVERSAPLSTPYPSTTSESSFGSSFERSLDSSSLSSRPSRERYRSHIASVPSPTHDSRSIAPTHAGLLPPCKRFRDSYSPEDSGDEQMEVDTGDVEAVANVGISDEVVAHTGDGVGMRVEITASDVRRMMRSLR
nr:hypothetical protein [Tanacetum cinerariifolium]